MDDGDTLTIVLIVGAIAFVELLRTRGAYGTNSVPALTPKRVTPNAPRALLDILVPLQLSAEGAAFIKSFDTLHLRRYLDAGKLAIGYGHDILQTDNLGPSITVQQANDLFAADIASVVQTINSVVTVQLSQRQFDALVSFVYNVGIDAFKGNPAHNRPPSTLLTMLNNGNIQGAAQQFQRWIYSEGKINPGLQRRRRGEAQMFASAAAS